MEPTLLRPRYNLPHPPPIPLSCQHICNIRSPHWGALPSGAPSPETFGDWPPIGGESKPDHIRPRQNHLPQERLLHPRPVRRVRRTMEPKLICACKGLRSGRWNWHSPVPTGAFLGNKGSGIASSATERRSAEVPKNRVSRTGFIAGSGSRRKHRSSVPARAPTIIVNSSRDQATSTTAGRRFGKVTGE